MQRLPQRRAVRAQRGADSELISELLARIDELQREVQSARQAGAETGRSMRALLEAGEEARVLTNPAGDVLAAGEATGVLLGADSRTLPGENLWSLLGLAAPWSPTAGRRGVSGLAMLAGPGSGRPVLVEMANEPDPGSTGIYCWTLTDFSRPLLPGESRPVTDPAQARTWLRAYAALIEVNQVLVSASADELERALERVPNRESESVLLDVQLARLVYRRRIWRGIHARLTGLTVDRKQGLLRNGGLDTRISSREAQLLAFLLDHPGVTFSAEALVTRAWHSNYLVAEQLRTYVVRCRTRLCEVDAHCEIVNVRGRGYRLDFEAA